MPLSAHFVLCTLEMATESNWMPLCSPAIKNTVIEEANKIYIKINLYSTCIQVLVGAKCHGDKTNAMFK